MKNDMSMLQWNLSKTDTIGTNDLSAVARCLVYPVGELFITGAAVETFSFFCDNFILLVSLNKIKTIPKSTTTQLIVIPVIAPIDKLWISSRHNICMHAHSIPNLLTL